MPLARAAFGALDALSETGISRPFDARRDGFVMGEGAARPRARGRREGPRARRQHPRLRPRLRRDLGRLPPDGARQGGRRRGRGDRVALADAGPAPEDIVYVNAHGTSTPLNDRAETNAIKAALGERAKDVPVSSTKSAIGHLLGAAGAVEAVATMLALRDRIAPPTLGYEQPERGPGPGLRAGQGPPPGHRRQARRRPVELLRVRRPQRGAVPGGRMTIEFVPQLEDKLSPIERLEALCDDGSLTLLRSDVRSRRMGEKARAGDGVIAGAGRVDGRPVFCYAQDPTYLGGSLGEQHADTIVRVLRLAGRAGAPVVGFIESGGARMQEGLAALAGYARIFREHVALSGRVPQISVICGASAGGGSYSPALTDFVVMTERANMFLTGPAVVKEVMGEDVERVRARRPEGPRPQRRRPLHRPHRLRRGAARARPARPPAVARGRRGAGVALGRSARLRPGRSGAGVRPQGLRRARRRCAAWSTAAACSSGARAGRATSSPASPASRASRSASSPTSRRYLGGVLDAESAAKGAKFVRTCNAFGIPLLVFVDTPGFMPGTQAGEGRRDPPRREARARVRRGERAEGDDRAAQGVRRGVHRHELARPRRGLRLRLAAGDARRHGRQAGRRDRQAARHRRGRRPRAARDRSPTSTATSTSRPRSPPPRATWTRSSRRATRAAG